MDKDKQMSFLFEEGGIADDGFDRDPVSGNEVPSGSMAEEVRDDIPAQLSEGEYVVPADVVRYYGVKFFEDLREDAKEGLTGMEEEGRIGGEPIDMEGDDTPLTPEEEAELMAITGMAVGGYVTDLQTQATDPYQAQTELYRSPAPIAIGNTGYTNNNNNQMMRRGFQEGGDTGAFSGGITYDETGTQVNFDPAQFAAGSTFADRPVILFSPEGIQETFFLPRQRTEYEAALASGYTRQGTPEATPEEAVTPEVQPQSQAAQGGGGGGGGSVVTPAGQPAPDLSELSIEQLQSNLRGLDTVGRIGGALAIGLNPVLALAVRAGMNANRLNIVQELERRGQDMSGYREENGKQLYGGGLGLYDGLQDINNDGRISFGDTWLGDALGFDGQAGVQGPSLRDSRGGSRRDFTPAASTSRSSPAAPAASGSSGGGGGGDNGGGGGTSRAPTSSPTPTQRPSGGTNYGSMSSSQVSSAQEAGKGYSGGYGFKEGGFVSRRNKTA
jgi:hypothetical protein